MTATGLRGWAISLVFVIGAISQYLGAAVGISLDQVVLTAVGRARFALLLALLPATAAIVGATVLEQWPTSVEVTGLMLVTVALMISATVSSANPPT